LSRPSKKPHPAEQTSLCGKAGNEITAFFAVKFPG